ncbi:MAG: nucleoside hydrolase [Chloroflexota bacterium]
MAGLMPVVIDVDTGIDDSLALLYACASPELELVAVTCCSGNVEARQVEVNTRAVLELAGRDDVDVALGREIPLVRPLATAPETHGPRGIGFAELPPPRRPLSDRHAADLIIEEADRRPRELTLITLGPLTNLALAVLRRPDLPKQLAGWVLMGGTYGAPGNTTPNSEWNIHVDPEAAKVCFDAWTAVEDARRPLALGLDVTERARILPDHVVRLARVAGSSPDDSIALEHGESPMVATRSVASNPIVRYIADALRFYMEFHADYDGFYGAFIHDALAVASAIDRSLVKARPVAVDVELAGSLTAGATIADWRGLWRRTPNVDVATEVDAETFLDRFVERVGGLAAERVNVAR